MEPTKRKVFSTFEAQIQTSSKVLGSSEARRNVSHRSGVEPRSASHQDNQPITVDDVRKFNPALFQQAVAIGVAQERARQIELLRNGIDTATEEMGARAGLSLSEMMAFSGPTVWPATERKGGL